MSKAILIDELMNKLNSFTSSKDVAEFLTNEKARGYKGDSDSCVITNWLEEKTELDVTTDDEVRFYTQYGYGEMDLLKVAPISDAVSEFITEFDGGNYPQLEWESYLD